jgi:uncharacterized protein with beta-barrel porin domain
MRKILLKVSWSVIFVSLVSACASQASAAITSCPNATASGTITSPIIDGGSTCHITITSTGYLQPAVIGANAVSVGGDVGSTVTNNGTITITTHSTGIGISDVSGTSSAITNNGTINSPTTSIYISGGSVTLTNTGTIIGGTYGIWSSIGLVTNLINTGTITGGTYGIWKSGSGSGSTVTNLTNTGTITTGSTTGSLGFLNAAPITVFTNDGAFVGGPGGFGVKNSGGTITTFNNSQGGNRATAATTALTYYGNLPVNYQIIVTSATHYGQLVATAPSGITTVGIYSGGVSGVAASVLATGTYSSVFSGLVSGNFTGATSGTYSGLSWSLVNHTGSTTDWDLVVTSGGGSSSGSGGGGSSGNSSGSSGSSTINVGPGGSFTLASVGVTANPVFAGGTLTLASAVASSQVFTVSSAGGIVQSPSKSSATLSGSISGVGSLIFIGTGTTVLSGSNTYTGGTTVASGTLSVQGSSPTGSGDVNVSTGGTLMGTGLINGRITVAGILKPGNSPGYLAASNTVTMNSGSTYQQDIAGTTQAAASSLVGATGYYSFLNITGGQFVINSGATLTPRLSNLFTSSEVGYQSAPYIPVLGDRFRIVTADGGISGKFATVTQPAELAAGTQFLPFYNMAGNNSVDLAVIPVSYKSTVDQASGNKNAQSVGAALDKLVLANQTGVSTATQDQLLYAGSTQTASSLSSYAQSLAGELYAATVAVIAQTTQRVQQAVLTRLGDTAGLALPNSSSAGNTSLMATTNTALNGGIAGTAVSSNPSVNPNTEAKAFLNGNVWGDLAYQYGNRTSDSNSGGWNSNLYQLVFGSDFISANGLKLGGGIALSNTTLNPTYGSATIQQGSVFAYGKMPIEEFVVDGMASFGLNSSDLSRADVTGLGNGFRNKSVSGNDALVSLGLSRPFDTDSVRITPFARAIWQIVTQSGVNEGGVASALNVNSYTGNGIRGVIGLAAGSKSNDPLSEQFTYRAYVGVGVDSPGLLNPMLTASLAGMSTNITTPNAGATFVQAGLYGTAKFANNAYVYAGLSGEARSNQTLGTVNVGLRVQF